MWSLRHRRIHIIAALNELNMLGTFLKSIPLMSPLSSFLTFGVLTHTS